MINNIKKIRSILDKYPWIPGAMTIAYVSFALFMVTIIVYFPSIGNIAPRFLSVASNILITGPIILAVLQILNLKQTITSIPKLAFLYLEIIL